MRLLILGTVLDPLHFSYNLAANPASTKWLTGFLGGLAANGVETSLCGHCYARVWPNGPLFPGNRDYLWSGCDNRLVHFLNFPAWRFKSMSRNYLRVAESVINEQPVDAIVTYNPYPWHNGPARKLRAKYGIPWVSLNLDFDDVGENWENFTRDAGDADGHLFLSHWGYENAPVERKIHLDSGVPEIPASFGALGETDPLAVVYLGKLGKAGGLDILLKLPGLVDAPNVRFIYGGKGYPAADAKLKALAVHDKRVKYLGFVEEREVAGLFERASVFLNPRDPDRVVNDMVFPSKIMQYLQHGKTVVSTWTKGLDPVYQDLMVIANSPQPADFAAAVESAIGESIQDRSVRVQRIREFLEGSRLWSKQAGRFVEFVDSITGRALEQPLKCRLSAHYFTRCPPSA